MSGASLIIKACVSFAAGWVTYFYLRPQGLQDPQGLRFPRIVAVNGRNQTSGKSFPVSLHGSRTFLLCANTCTIVVRGAAGRVHACCASGGIHLCHVLHKKRCPKIETPATNNKSWCEPQTLDRISQTSAETNDILRSSGFWSPANGGFDAAL